MSLSLKGCVFMKVLILIITIFGFAQSFPRKSWAVSENHKYNFFNNYFSVAFTINSSGCSIPGMMVHDNYLKKLVNNITPCPNSDHPLLHSNQTHIWVATEHYPHYHIEKTSLFECCYQSFHQSSGMPFDKSLIDNIIYLDCIMFDKIIEAANEFVHVRCFYNNKVIYKQYFTFIPKKYFDIPQDIERDQQTYNVIIMGLKSMSRMNTHRSMPNTYNVLMELGAIVLFGYHAIANKTLENMVPLLAGMTTHEQNLTCFPRSQSLLDSCSFIWERFKDIGYHTALIEDTAKSGLFNSKMFGVSSSPTDYYVHPLIQETEDIETEVTFQYTRKRMRIFKTPMKTIKTKPKNSICMGDKYYFRFILEYIERLTTILRTSKLFGVFWESSMSKDLNGPKLMDKEYEKLIRKLEETGYLNHTILILISDQGHADALTSKQGRLEQRLPLAAILTPPAFRKQYNVAYESLKINSNRITTPFDIYETLIDLTNLKSLKNNNIINRSNSNLIHERGMSLFLPVPNYRTCVSAGVSEEWCTCHKTRKVKDKSELANNAVTYILTHLNWLLRLYPQCARLSIDKIIYFDELYPTYGKELEWREFKVVVRMKPGAGEYEALLRLDGDVGWSLMTQVRKLNVGKEHDNCVHDSQIQLYCQCSA